MHLISGTLYLELGLKLIIFQKTQKVNEWSHPNHKHTFHTYLTARYFWLGFRCSSLFIKPVGKTHKLILKLIRHTPTKHCHLETCLEVAKHRWRIYFCSVIKQQHYCRSVVEFEASDLLRFTLTCRNISYTLIQQMCVNKVHVMMQNHTHSPNTYRNDITHLCLRIQRFHSYNKRIIRK